jgi:hypothetical protein
VCRDTTTVRGTDVRRDVARAQMGCRPAKGARHWRNPPSGGPQELDWERTVSGITVSPI